MSSSEAAAHVAPHFADGEQEKRAAHLGMWLFLVNEMLLFAGLFTGYAVYRSLFPEAFIGGSRHLDLFAGTLNTVVLVTSSFTVASAIHFGRVGRSRVAAVLLAVTLLLGLAFLVIKTREWLHHFEVGALPGRAYADPSFREPAAPMFFTVYFFLTGLHAFHVLAGMGVLAWLAVRAARNAFSGAYYTPLELGGMFWHLVDLVWIFLFPLLYLV